MSVILLPLALCEKELQSHDKSGAFSLPTVDHAGKAAETALKRAHVDALAGRPLLLGQYAGAVKAHLPGGRNLVVGKVEANQGYGHFKKSAILAPARRARVHVPPRNSAKNGGDRRTGWQTIRRLCRSDTMTTIRHSTYRELRS